MTKINTWNLFLESNGSTENYLKQVFSLLSDEYTVIKEIFYLVGMSKAPNPISHHFSNNRGPFWAHENPVVNIYQIYFKFETDDFDPETINGIMDQIEGSLGDDKFIFASFVFEDPIIYRKGRKYFVKFEIYYEIVDLSNPKNVNNLGKYRMDLYKKEVKPSRFTL